MGFNTTVVVLNDALSDIEQDPDFGKKLAAAIRSVSCYNKPIDVSAMGHCNAASVIESHHADNSVYVKVGGNYGEIVAPELIKKQPKSRTTPKIFEVFLPDKEEEQVCCRKCWEESHGEKAIGVGDALINPIGMPMIGCKVCGNKRCPKATDHNNECSGSNSQGQVGSVYHNPHETCSVCGDTGWVIVFEGSPTMPCLCPQGKLRVTEVKNSLKNIYIDIIEFAKETLSFHNELYFIVHGTTGRTRGTPGYYTDFVGCISSIKYQIDFIIDDLKRSADLNAESSLYKQTLEKFQIHAIKLEENIEKVINNYGTKYHTMEHITGISILNVIFLLHIAKGHCDTILALEQRKA